MAMAKHPIWDFIKDTAGPAILDVLQKNQSQCFMSVFTTKLTKHIFFTDALPRFNCGIQRYKELIAYALCAPCTPLGMGSMQVAAIGVGAGRKQKTKETFQNMN